MRLISYDRGQGIRAAVHLAHLSAYMDLAVALGNASYTSMRSFLEDGEAALNAARIHSLTLPTQRYT